VPLVRASTPHSNGLRIPLPNKPEFRYVLRKRCTAVARSFSVKTTGDSQVGLGATKNKNKKSPKNQQINQSIDDRHTELPHDMYDVQKVATNSTYSHVQPQNPNLLNLTNHPSTGAVVVLQRRHHFQRWTPLGRSGTTLAPCEFASEKSHLPMDIFRTLAQ